MRTVSFAAAVIGLCCLTATNAAADATEGLLDLVDQRARAVEDSVIAWREDIHRHPELSNREFRTAALVARHLESLGLRVRTGVAHTGVVAVLDSGRPGPTVALRADMDALPVKEVVDLPFASTATAEYMGKTVPVMHACGHDVHTAMLMGTAEVLAGLRDELSGKVMFIFQPAEEGAPIGEEGGAVLMLKEGLFEPLEPDAIFALHVGPNAAPPAGSFIISPGGVLASADDFEITLEGRQTHAGFPWQGVDLIATGARIVLALQALPGRETDARVPAVVSVGRFHAGVRTNIIPAKLTLGGTIRALSEEVRSALQEKLVQTTQVLAELAGATATVEIHRGLPPVVNDEALAVWTRGVLTSMSGEGQVFPWQPELGSEDFSFYSQKVPGVYIGMSLRPPEVPAEEASRPHSPNFFVDQRETIQGVRALSRLAVEFQHRAPRESRDRHKDPAVHR